MRGMIERVKRVKKVEGSKSVGRLDLFDSSTLEPLQTKKPCGLSTAGLGCSSLFAKPLRSRLPNSNDANRRPDGGAKDRNVSRNLHAIRVACASMGHSNHTSGHGDCQLGHL